MDILSNCMGLNPTPIALLLLCAVAVSAIHIHNRKLHDDQNREIRFHGTNIVVKVPPYIPRTDSYDPEWSFCEEDMLKLKQWGFNGIRLGMMWAGVEPTPNTYNETYLDEMQGIINRAGAHGIYTLMDFHQDLIAEQFCGDGVPNWLMQELGFYKTFPFPVSKHIKLNSSGLPDWQKCNQDGWGLYYLSYDVGRAFGELYKPNSHLNKKFTDYWVKVATRFRGNKYVIGYQLINEPFVGNADRNLMLLVPSVAERVHFQQFYDRLSNQIRKVDPDTLIFFQPITFDNTIPVGFTHPPGGKRFANTSVLAYHYEVPLDYTFNTIDARVKDGERLGVASFLTEFHIHSTEILEKAQKYQQSWLFWKYKPYGKDWGSTYPKDDPNNPDVIIEENRTHTYLQRIAGELHREQFDFTTKHYVANFTATPNGESILFYSREYNYPKGYDIELVPRSQMSFEEVAPGYIHIRYTGESSRVVQVSLQRL